MDTLAIYNYIEIKQHNPKWPVKKEFIWEIKK